MSVAREIIRAWLPPALLRRVRQIRAGRIGFEGEYATWQEASDQCSGYHAEGILEKVLAATLKVKRSEAAFERDSVTFDEIEYSWPLLAGLMWAAARNGGRLNVLDFGGALGSSYFQNHKFLQALPQVCWNVVEQAHYVEAGQTYIQDKQLRFYKTIRDCLMENQPNVILLSSVLQYLHSPNDTIDQLSDAGAGCLIIDRTPLSTLEVDKILVQNVPESIYPASYPMWVFSYSKFMCMFDVKWNLVARTPSAEGLIHTRSGFEFVFQGMLLESCQ